MVSVAIGVCTAYRPHVLASCLAAVVRQVVPDGCRLTAIVADNEAEPNSRPMVEALAQACPFPVRYVHEPRRGIPQARNAVLEACGDAFDWIAFTDDDCQPAPDWIACLLAAAERHGADVVEGRREWIAPEPAPFWFSMPRPSRRAEGQPLQLAATYNVLMTGRLLRPETRLRFDERLAHGEDTDFFHRAAVLHGARIVYSAAPVVHESIPPQRATLRYQLRRDLHLAAGKMDFQRRTKGASAAALRLLAHVAGALPISAAHLVAAALAAPFDLALFKRLVLKGAGRLARTAGEVSGFAGFIGDPYRNIDIRLSASDTVVPTPVMEETRARRG